MSGKRDAPVTRTNPKNQFQSFDQNQIISKQKLLQAKYHEALDNHAFQYFQKMKYNGFIYEIGQFVELFHYKSKAPYVAKINKIIRVKQKDQKSNVQESPQQVPFLEVEWFMSKSELSQEKITNQYFQCLSNSQVFGSGNLFYIYIESITSKCQVLNFQQYWNISQSSPGIYFTRATYNPKTKLLSPSPSTWKKFCYCSSPYNPDLEFVQCETCQEWIHSECDPEQVFKDDFICRKCRTKQKTSKKK